MTKAELVSAIAQKTEFTKKDSERFLNAALEAITEELANGGKVQITGFGTFEVKERAERTGVNPRTKEEIIIAASKAPSFKAGKAFKDAIDK